MDPRISSDGRGHGEDQPHGGRIGGAQRIEKDRQQTKGRTGRNQADKPRAEQAGAGLVGELRCGQSGHGAIL